MNHLKILGFNLSRDKVGWFNLIKQPTFPSPLSLKVSIKRPIFTDIKDEPPKPLKLKGLPSREYVFGYCSLLPIFKLKRRKIYKLFVLESAIPKEELEGKKGCPVEAFLNRKIRKKVSQVLSENKRSEILALAKQSEVKIIPTSRARLDQLSEGSPHQGVVAQVGILHLSTLKFIGRVNEQDNSYELGLSDVKTLEGPHPMRLGTFKKPFWVVLDRIQDPHNLGAIIRSAHYLGADGVIITSEASAGPTPTVSKTSAGALEILPIYQVHGLASFLTRTKANGWLILGTGFTQNSVPISTLSPHLNCPTILVFGNEGFGISPTVAEVCDHLLYIPGHASGPMEVGSLNVSVAAGILINSLRNSPSA